jgi:hypothetical protein
MIEMANQLSATVQSLRAVGHPSRAVILDALAVLPVKRLAAIIEHRALSGDDVHLVVETTGHHPLAVADVLRKFTQYDCADYRAMYTHLVTECRSTAADIVSEPGLGWREEDDLVRFLLHDIICCWNGRESRLGRGLVIEDDRQYLLARCYLIVRQRAFPTTIDLLQTAYRHRWANWQALWKYF